MLKILLFVLMMFSCGGLMWIIYVNKKILLKNKEELFIFFKGGNKDYKSKGKNMNELSNIKNKKVENFGVDPKITQELLYI
jgi:hypothetical protein